MSNLADEHLQGLEIEQSVLEFFRGDGAIEDLGLVCNYHSQLGPCLHQHLLEQTEFLHIR